jgi:glycosyltransferase domain-containing protein
MAMNSGALKKLTLLVLTLNRQKFALRNMQYWSNRDAALIVLDGSNSSIDPNHLEGLGENIKYLHMPIDVFGRIGAATKLINTEYCALMGDDEFFIPSALEACINELDNSNDLIACFGRCISFNFYKSTLYAKISYVEMENYSLLHDKPHVRMIEHMNPYTSSTIYAVTRTDEWINSMQIISTREFKPFNLPEVQHELAICYQGKSKVLPVLMWLRSLENTSIRDLNIKERDKNYFIENWWSDIRCSGEREEFLVQMSKGLSRAANGGKFDYVYISIVEAMDVYVSSNKYTPSFGDNLYSMALSLTPKLVKKILRNIRIYKQNYINNRAGTLPLLEVVDVLMSKGIEVNTAQLLEIEECISNSYAHS